jgi:hypothetical protein
MLRRSPIRASILPDQWRLLRCTTRDGVDAFKYRERRAHGR